MKFGLVAVFAILGMLLFCQAGTAEPIALAVIEDTSGGGHASYVFANHSGIYVSERSAVKLVTKATSVTAIAVVPGIRDDPMLLFANSTGIYKIDVGRKSFGCNGPCMNPPWVWRFGIVSPVKKTTSVTALSYRASKRETCFTNATGIYAFTMRVEFVGPRNANLAFGATYRICTT